MGFCEAREMGCLPLSAPSTPLCIMQPLSLCFGLMPPISIYLTQPLSISHATKFSQIFDIFLLFLLPISRFKSNLSRPICLVWLETDLHRRHKAEIDLFGMLLISSISWDFVLFSEYFFWGFLWSVSVSISCVIWVIAIVLGNLGGFWCVIDSHLNSRTFAYPNLLP